jgi:hypothetical protein
MKRFTRKGAKFSSLFCTMKPGFQAASGRQLPVPKQQICASSVRYCQLNFMKKQNHQLRQDESTSCHLVD